MRRKNNRGFSLVEMMVTMGIFSFIIAAIYSVLNVGNVSWFMQNANVHVQSQARMTIDKMARDLRVADGLTIVQDDDNVDVSFSKNGIDISYAWTTDAGVTQYQLIRTADAVPIIAGRDITALSVTETATDITINLTVGVVAQGRNINYSLLGNVAKR